MKRRQIVSIFVALTLAVSSAVLFTGCKSKTYYYSVDEAGGWVKVGEAIDTTDESSAADTATDSTAPAEESSAPAEESSAPAEESSAAAEESSAAAEESSEAEEVSQAEESSEAAGDDIQKDENTLAVIKFEKPDDWVADSLFLRVYDSESNNNTRDGQKMTLGTDGLYYCVVSKIADSGNEFKEPKFIFLATSQATGRIVQSEEGVVDGDKSYGVQLDGRKFMLVEK